MTLSSGCQLVMVSIWVIHGDDGKSELINDVVAHGITVRSSFVPVFNSNSSHAITPLDSSMQLVSQPMLLQMLEHSRTPKTHHSKVLRVIKRHNVLVTLRRYTGARHITRKTDLPLPALNRDRLYGTAEKDSRLRVGVKMTMQLHPSLKRQYSASA